MLDNVWYQSTKLDLDKSCAGGGVEVSGQAPVHPGRVRRVFVLDKDADTLSRIAGILESPGIQVKCFNQPASLLAKSPPPPPCCLILDTDLGEGPQGIEIHRQLLDSGWRVPTLFLSACKDVRTVVAAMHNGADNYLTKPFDPDELVRVVSTALEHSERLARDNINADYARTFVAILTPMEREVVSHVIFGLLNKEIASKLGIALVTVKVHRGRAMRKLGAGNPAELARIASLGGIK